MSNTSKVNHSIREARFRDELLQAVSDVCVRYGGGNEDHPTPLGLRDAIEVLEGWEYVQLNTLTGERDV